MIIINSSGCERIRNCLFILAAFLPATFFEPVAAQLKSYSLDSGLIKSSTERVEIFVEPAAVTRSAGPAISLPGVLGSFLTFGVNGVKTVLSTEQEKYTASYTGMVTGTHLMEINTPSVFLNIEAVHITRTLLFPDLTEEMASEIVLVPQVDFESGLFRFLIKSINMTASKAKIKRNGKWGKTLDLSLNIKLESIWQENATQSKNDSAPKTDSSISYKSAVLGESTILIPGVKPNGPNAVRAQFYSGWFQMISSSAIKYAQMKNLTGIGNYTLTITVKEANPYGISSKKLSDFLNGTSPDINNLIKQILPAANK